MGFALLADPPRRSYLKPPIKRGAVCEPAEAVKVTLWFVLIPAGRQQAHVSAHGHQAASGVPEEAAAGERKLAALQTPQPHVSTRLAGL